MTIARRYPMLDFAYIAATLAFFALMLAFVRACARLGQRGGNDVERLR